MALGRAPALFAQRQGAKPPCGITTAEQPLWQVSETKVLQGKATPRWHAVHCSSMCSMTCGSLAALAAHKGVPSRQKAARRRSMWRFATTTGQSLGKVTLLNDAEASRTSDTVPVRTFKPFQPHLRSQEVKVGLQVGRFVQGRLTMRSNTCTMAMVKIEQEEMMISGSHALNRAIDGDLVVVERLNTEEAEEYERAAKRLRHGMYGNENVDVSVQQSMTFQGRTRGRVVAIMRREYKDIAGSLVSADEAEEQGVMGLDKAKRLLVPADKRFPMAVVKLPESLKPEELENTRVLVTVTMWDKDSEYPQAKFQRTIGKVGDINTETEMLLLEWRISNAPWTQEVLDCLPPDDFQPTEKDLLGREDFRDVCVCSIDPEGCEDVDDALSCEALDSGNFRIGVHIADVTHFMLPDTPLDREAQARGTSVYLQDRRIDMLPRLLTTDVCSLRCDGKPRLTFSCIMELNKDAKIIKSRFCKAIIKSRAALSYAQAQEILDDPDDTSELAIAVKQLNKLAKVRRQQRMNRGALELESDEIKFEVDSETLQPTELFKYVTRDTNKLIEEFMLLANEESAKQINRFFRQISVLRHHPPPRGEFMEELAELLKCHGIEDFKWGSNRELQDSLESAQKESDPFFNRLVRMMTTRCMSRAKYFCTGKLKKDEYFHYGLALQRYTHFTSPIRRYADDIVHRMLAATLAISPLPNSMQSLELLDNVVEHINLKADNAKAASRESTAFHLFLYFKAMGRVVAEGVVMRISPVAVQVAVEEYGAEGDMEMSELDWNIFPKKQRVFGRPLSNFEGVNFGIFDRVIVSVEADLEDNRQRDLKIEFIGLPKAADRSSPDEEPHIAVPIEKSVAA